MTYHVQFDLSFTKNAYPGKYYGFEGIDGSGKTTQVENLAQYFRKQGKEVFITKEPTQNIIGKLIHKVISGEITVPAASLQYLFSADRALHLQEEVIPALKMGKVVISDRTLWSAVAYGIADLGLQENEKQRMLVALNVLAMYGGFLIADKTFVINVPYETAIGRVKTRGEDLTLYEKSEKLKKVQQEYAWMAQKFPEALKLIDGTKEKQVVFAEILQNI